MQCPECKLEANCAQYDSKAGGMWYLHQTSACFSRNQLSLFRRIRIVRAR